MKRVVDVKMQVFDDDLCDEYLLGDQCVVACVRVYQDFERVTFQNTKPF